jgi:hypothetical protein
MFFSCGLGPVPAILSSEVLSDVIRSKGMGLAMCVNWSSNFCVSLIYPLLLTSALQPSGTYFMFAGVTLLGACCVAYSVSETKGLRLEDMLEPDETKSGLIEGQSSSGGA